MAAAEAVQKGSLSKALAETVRNLYDPDQAVLACATLAVLAGTAQEDVPELGQAVPKLLTLFQEGGSVQRNACAALSAVIEASPRGYEACVTCGLKRKVQALDQGLRGSSHAVNRQAEKVVQAMTAKEAESSIQLNGAALLGCFAEAGGEAGLQEVLEADGVSALLQLLNLQLDAALQEAGVDALCKIATVEASRPALAEQGAVEALGSMLQSASCEVQVRTLLALGMLVGSDDSRASMQRRLISTPGAIQQLLALMRQRGDADCSQIASGIFATLAKTPEVKGLMASALKSQDAKTQESFVN